MKTAQARARDNAKKKERYNNDLEYREKIKERRRRCYKSRREQEKHYSYIYYWVRKKGLTQEEAEAKWQRKRTLKTE